MRQNTDTCLPDMQQIVSRFTVSKQAAKKFDRERLNLRKLNEPEVSKQYQIEITNRFAALETLNNEEVINREY